MHCELCWLTAVLDLNLNSILSIFQLIKSKGVLIEREGNLMIKGKHLTSKGEIARPLLQSGTLHIRISCEGSPTIKVWAAQDESIAQRAYNRDSDLKENRDFYFLDATAFRECSPLVKAAGCIRKKVARKASKSKRACPDFEWRDDSEEGGAGLLRIKFQSYSRESEAGEQCDLFVCKYRLVRPYWSVTR